MRRTAVAIRHVHFEDLGVFEAVLAGVGYKTRYHDIGVHDLSTVDPLKTDLVVILGAPVGVYEADDYRFPAEQRKFLKTRLAAGRPTFGICLGAQQIAASLGANVAPTGVNEIGFSPLSLTEEGQMSPLRHLADVPVLHWHGDAFAPTLARLTARLEKSFPRTAAAKYPLRRISGLVRIPNPALSIGRAMLNLRY